MATHTASVVLPELAINGTVVDPAQLLMPHLEGRRRRRLRCEGEATFLYSRVVPLPLRSGCVTDTGSSIDLPHDAHLTVHGNESRLLVPVFCVADRRNISALMTSVLHQRRVLGLEEFAVGICISKFEHLAQLVFGWLEGTPGDGEGDLVSTNFPTGIISLSSWLNS